MNSENKKTYFDVAATTPLDPEVANLMHDINLSFLAIHQVFINLVKKLIIFLKKAEKKYHQYLIAMSLKLFLHRVELNPTI